LFDVLKGVMDMKINRSMVLMAVAVLLVGIVTMAACGGGGGSSDQATSTTFNASAAAGDFIELTVNNDGTYAYENFTTSRVESGTYSQDPATGELSFTADTSTGGGGDGTPSELATGFSAPGIGIVLIATHTGATRDKESIVFGIRQQTHNLDDIIGLVEPGTGGTAEYVYLQFRTNDGGFELGAATILEEQDFTDTLDIDEDGSIIDTITGAPLIPHSYSPIYGDPDPIGTGVDMTFSTDIINASSSTPLPFLQLAPDASHIILRSWEYDTCNKGDFGCTPTLAGNILFFNSTMEKIIMDSPYGSGIILKMAGSDTWSSTYEGTYTLVSYVGSGTATSDQDTAGLWEDLRLTFGNDGLGNGTISVGPVGGPDDFTDQLLTSFNEMASADSLLGSVVSQWPTDGSIPLNGVFGFRGAGGTIGVENFVVFSEGTVFILRAELNGPRIAGGDLDGWPTAYSYQFGVGVKIP